MLSETEIFNTEKQHYVGKFVFAPHIGNIVRIELPEDKEIFTISAKDLPVPRIKVLNDFIPIFAQSTVEYPSQPVMAVFGKDVENVDLYISEINIVMNEENNDEDTPIQAGVPFKFTSGNISDFFKNENNVISSKFEVLNHSETILGAQKFYANESDGKMCIKTASAWPLHVRDTVADVLKISRHDVHIFPQPYSTTFDQLLIQPSMICAVAAIASKKIGAMVEIQESISSWQPHTTYELSTQLDENNKPVAHRIDVKVDFGAYPLFTEEACYGIMGGLVPTYKMDALQITITPFKSNRCPSIFFCDLGYGIALAATEQHFNYLIHKLRTNPFRWRLENITETFSIRDNVKRSQDAKSIPVMINDCSVESDFEKKHVAYSQISAKNRIARSIISYSRGVGISCGQGVHGFSNRFPYLVQYSASMTMSEKKKMAVSIGYNMNRPLKKIARDMIQNYFAIDTDDITFTDINDETVKDVGPAVLFRSTGMIPKLIENTCLALKEKVDAGETLPISVENYSTSYDTSAFFASCCCGSMVIDMHIDTVRIVPVIDHITARLKLGKVYNTTSLADGVRHMISRTISEICPCADNRADIDLLIRSNPNNLPGSSASLIRGLTTSALTTAISQAMTYNIQKIPITENDLMNILLHQGEKHEA